MMFPKSSSFKVWLKFLSNFKHSYSNISYMETGDEQTEVYLFDNHVVWHKFILFEDDPAKNHLEISVHLRNNRSERGYESLYHNPYGQAIVYSEPYKDRTHYYLDGKCLQKEEWKKLKEQYLVRENKVKSIKKKLDSL